MARRSKPRGHGTLRSPPKQPEKPLKVRDLSGGRQGTRGTGSCLDAATADSGCGGWQSTRKAVLGRDGRPARRGGEAMWKEGRRREAEGEDPRGGGTLHANGRKGEERRRNEGREGEGER